LYYIFGPTRLYSLKNSIVADFAEKDIKFKVKLETFICSIVVKYINKAC